MAIILKYFWQTMKGPVHSDSSVSGKQTPTCSCMDLPGRKIQVTQSNTNSGSSLSFQ